MDRETYIAEATAEETHWWFVGRRRLFGREIRSLALAQDANILDVGTSTGTNLRMLRDLGFTNVSGLDASDEAIRFCQEKGFDYVHKGDACAMPFYDCSFDLVLATDVIEHLDDDVGALREIVRVLRPGGHVLITVPAFSSLWGLQDDVSHHKRRYRKQALNSLVTGASLHIDRSFYFNFILFVPIWLARQALQFFKPNVRSENQLNNTSLNHILGAVFDFDCKIAPTFNPPFGVSILTLARR